MSGGDSKMETPVPIPNTEVKHLYADGSKFNLARVGSCQAFSLIKNNGGLAQLGEHLPYKQRVSGSSPLSSTICRLSSIGRATDL